MSEPKRYDLNTIADFLAIPPARIDVCLREFGAAIRSAHAMCWLVREIEGEMYGRRTIDLMRVGFTWIDDDEGHLAITVRIPGTETP